MIDLYKKRILIISPHPDDEAIGAGGLIMLAKKQKAEVMVLYMALGESRQFMSNKGITRVAERKAEALEASEFGGFSLAFAFEEGATKMDMKPQKEIIEQIEDWTEKFEPDIVVIPFRNSFNQDHRAVATACISAFRPMPSSLRHQPNIILEMEEPYTWGIDENFKPNFYVDISDVINEKMGLYECHKSQVPVQVVFPRSCLNLTVLSHFRGSQVSVDHAEAFNLLRGKFV